MTNRLEALHDSEENEVKWENFKTTATEAAKITIYT